MTHTRLPILVWLLAADGCATSIEDARHRRQANQATQQLRAQQGWHEGYDPQAVRPSGAGLLPEQQLQLKPIPSP
jgi:hypothetical protein